MRKVSAPSALEKLITHPMEADSALFSISERVPALEPALFFRNARRLAGLPIRVYWSNSARSQTIVGVGSVWEFRCDGLDRFAVAWQAWTDLLGTRVNARDQAAEGELPLGVGPLLLGGFSFDPLRPSSEVWQAFPDARLVLPRHMLTITEGTTWLTTNVVVQGGEDLGVLRDALDHEREQLQASRTDEPFSSVPVKLWLDERDVPRWLDAVRHLAGEIREGRLQKIVLSREVNVHAPTELDLDHILDRLATTTSGSYIFVFDTGDRCFVSNTPERLIAVEGTRVDAACVAGSTRRGASPQEDERLAVDLHRDAKNREEHQLVVDMVRGVLEDFCDSVECRDEPSVHRLDDIQHLVTPIIGLARGPVSILPIVERLHPTPALAGMPRSEALEHIRETEPFDRGWYGGPIGWFNEKGEGEFAVAIRSGLIRGAEATLIAGCGIVGASVPEDEYRETTWKLRPMIAALGGDPDDAR